MFIPKYIIPFGIKYALNSLSLSVSSFLRSVISWQLPTANKGIPWSLKSTSQRSSIFSIPVLVNSVHFNIVFCEAASEF
jgi:hypothetical protein